MPCFSSAWKIATGVLLNCSANSQRKASEVSSTACFNTSLAFVPNSNPPFELFLSNRTYVSAGIPNASCNWFKVSVSGSTPDMAISLQAVVLAEYID